jgi:hypothetical protein
MDHIVGQRLSDQSTRALDTAHEEYSISSYVYSVDDLSA